MYLPRDEACSSLRRKRWAGVDAQPCHSAWSGQKRGVCERKESEGELGLCLDNLSYDLDAEITTKSSLRALKLT